MKYVFAYTRVSTVKQGSEGVSLPEQKDSITRYCDRNELTVIKWFEETETAAKRGRTLYTEMMKLLEKGSAQGVVFHKIDRSTRNLGEWAEVSSLPERGIDVHYSHEPVDLTTNHGRTAADVAAVFASAYIRNLRDEVRKGIQGRLKQGLYPFKAPIGYLDNGKAKLKTIDPIKGPIIREMFELYESGEYSILTLVNWLNENQTIGSRKGKISKHGVSIILHNSFYMGVIHIRRTNQSYAGNHEPLISPALFKSVQDVFTGRIRPKVTKHKYQYQKLLTCFDCERVLVGETQKGHVYYRCHSCKAKCYPEELFSQYLKFAISKADTQGCDLSSLKLDIQAHLNISQTSSR